MILVGIALLSPSAVDQSTPHPGGAPSEHLLPAAVLVTPQEIPLRGPMAASRAELSGLTTTGEHLILLPQYPTRFPHLEAGGSLFFLSVEEIADAVRHTPPTPLTPQPLPFHQNGIEQHIPGFEGFESIHIAGEEVLLLMESRDRGVMRSHIARGSWHPERGVQLIPHALHQLPLPNQHPNRSREALALFEDHLVVIEELLPTDSPHLLALTPDLRSSTRHPIPYLPFRITAAAVQPTPQLLWLMNYHWPGDDPWYRRFRGDRRVERLIALERGETGFEVRHVAHFTLDPDPLIARNWEGLAWVGEGLVMVTDQYPRSMLAYLPISAVVSAEASSAN